MKKGCLGGLLVVVALWGGLCASMVTFRSTCPPEELEQVDTCSGHAFAFLQGHTRTLEAKGRPKQSFCHGGAQARPIHCVIAGAPETWRCEGQYWEGFLRVAAYAPDCSAATVWIRDVVQEPAWLDNAPGAPAH